MIARNEVIQRAINELERHSGPGPSNRALELKSLMDQAMTTNQTIDGVLVSRELLERFVSDVEAHNYGFEGLDELRALLDAKPESVAGHHPACRAVDDYKPGECSHNCKPAAHPKGVPVPKSKPVAKLHAERLTGRDGEYGITVEDSQWFNTCRLTGGEFYLYAEQPEPVAVVMPERKPDANRSFEGTDAEWYGNISWNACLDELKNLNPSL